ncbi:PilN domain-containing protein [Natroniella sulfidigena]|uniref:PilN domain-containing protein n=1 Tax=Natroniella sulfidigena TaxID=723921 RepID=UPI00200B443B|nr:PilN domain-containing protein [Natroniella sulfidigena]MCK8817489.1 PilN domain-containing protein [Natroniella sulfidigena]
MVDLLPLKIKKERRYNRYKRVSLLVLSCLLVAVLGWGLYSNSLVVEYQKELEETKEESVELSLVELERLEQRQQVIAEVGAEQLLSYGQIVADLNLIIPASIWIEEFVITAEERLLITAKATDDQQLLKVISRLNKYPFFAQVELLDTERLADGTILLELEGEVKE